MNKLSREYPFLKHLDDKTTLFTSQSFLKADAKWSRWIQEHQEDPKAIYRGYVIGFGSDDDIYPQLVPTVMASVNVNWPIMMSMFRTNVALVSEPFMEAGKQAAEAFKKDLITTSAYLAGKTFSGTVLVSSRRETVGYYLSYDGRGELQDYAILWLSRDGSISGYIVPDIQFLSRSVLVDDSNRMKSQNCMLLLGDKPLNALSAGIIDTVKSFILFCHFAEITDEFVARPGSCKAREQAQTDDALVNDTHVNVRRLDVSYYKNICRDEDFAVRGHFRMQPYGVGRTRRRLIYVDSFVKHGYHRCAGKITVGEFDTGITHGM